MKITKKSDVLVPEVLADMISAKLPTANTLLKIFEVDTTLEGQEGDTITIPRWNMVSDAEDIAEGVEAVSDKLTHSTQKVTIKKVIKDIEITDEVKLAAYGDVEGEVERQLRGAIAGKMANDIITALGGTILKVTGELTEVLIQDATDKLVVDMEEEGQDFERYLLASKDVVSGLRRIKAIQDVDKSIVIKGVVGQIDGCFVIPIQRIPSGKAFIVKTDAAKVYSKRKPEVEYDRLVKGKKDLYSADHHYIAALNNEGSVVEITVTAPVRNKNKDKV